MPGPVVVVVGLGPAGPELINAATTAAIARVPARFLRTARHPAAAAIDGAQSFDGAYDSAADLDEVYGRIVDALVEAAVAEGTVLYAVPGSPVVAERSVAMLAADGRVATEIVPALSFLDLAWARLGVDPLASAVRLVDGRRFAVEAAAERGPLLVAQCDAPHVLSEIKLSLDSHRGPEVTVLQRLGSATESVSTVAWEDLDREVEPDHLTSIYIPELASPVAAEVTRFEELVRTLRERCPWDREQTHHTLTRHLLEETYEVLEAIESLPEGGGHHGVTAVEADASAWAHLEEELGDLLFQVVFHSVLAAESGRFTLANVARTVHDKLVGRHPHVFGDVEATTAGQVMENWEQIKKAEKGHDSLMDGIAGGLPSLLYAHKVQRKAAAVGLDPDPAVAVRLARYQESPSSEALGELLLALVASARRAGLDPEAALRGAAAAYRRRFMAMEQTAEAAGLSLRHLSATELAARWEATRVTPGADR